MKTETTHRAQQELGPVVIGGVIQWLSATLITLGDPTQDGGCNLRFWFKYVAEFGEPEFEAQKKGKLVHDEIEHYLKTGEMVLGRIALAGRPFLPDRRHVPSLMVEQSILDWGLTAAGIRVAGHSDLFNLSGYYVNDRGMECADAPNTGEVKDWKSTKSIDRYAKSGPQLYKTVQMPTYGKALLTKHPTLENARLTHTYFQTEGQPAAKLTTIFKSRAEIDARWSEIEGTVRTLKDVALETDPSKIEGNRKACKAFRGCPHAMRCPQGQAGSLSAMFGEAGAREILGIEQEESKMSLLETLNLPGAKPAPTVATAAPSVNLSVADEIAKLRAAETPPPAAAAPGVAPGFAEAVAVIEAAGFGFPSTAGEAAQMLGRLRGYEVTAGAGLSGSGALASATLRTVAEVIGAANELQGKAAPAAPAPAPAPKVDTGGLLPPETPASNPALAADPVPGFSEPIPAMPAEGYPAAATTEPPKAKRGRKPKGGESPIATDTPRGTPAALDATATAPGYTKPDASAPVTVAPASGLEIYVNAIPSGSFDTLDEYVDEINRSLSEHFGCADVRFPPDDKNAMSFGKWKGAVAMVAREKPPAPGTYVILTRGSELHEIVADALRSKADHYVRGIV